MIIAECPLVCICSLCISVDEIKDLHLFMGVHLCGLYRCTKINAGMLFRKTQRSILNFT